MECQAPPTGTEFSASDQCLLLKATCDAKAKPSRRQSSVFRSGLAIFVPWAPRLLASVLLLRSQWKQPTFQSTSKEKQTYYWSRKQEKGKKMFFDNVAKESNIFLRKIADYCYIKVYCQECRLWQSGEITDMVHAKEPAILVSVTCLPTNIWWHLDEI